MKGNVKAIAQARMSSSRLPGKVLRTIDDKTIIGHLISRLKKAQTIDEIIIATSDDKSDNPIEEECKKYNVSCFRGSLNDVLGRFYGASKEYNAQNIVRICCDSPLIDWNMVDDVVNFYLNNDYDIVLNTGVPIGFAFEVFKYKKLEEAFFYSKNDYHREHVTPYIYENTDKCYLYKNDLDYSKYRFTLDTEKDFELLKEVFKNLYKGEHDFHMKDVVNLLKDKPELYDINKEVVQKSKALDYVKK